jgi:very-short-patch-repair endonuclease
MDDVGRLRPDIGASTDPRDRAIAALANRQHGVVAYWQLIRLGFGRRAIQHRVHAGRLHRIHVGVYAVGHRLLTAAGWAMAAVLACGPGAVLSHLSAAHHWQLVRNARQRVDVTVPSRSGREQPRIAVHRARSLDARDTVVHNRIPVTTVARTLLDLAEVVDESRLTRTIEAAERQRTFDLNAVNDLLERSHGRHGTRRLRAVLNAAVIEPASESDLESLFHDLIGQAGLQRPIANAIVEGFKVDAYWPDLKLIVEIDSYAYHRSPQAFERDRKRDVQLQLAGYTVLRFTDRQLNSEPRSVVAALAQAQRSACARRSLPPAPRTLP